MSKSKKTQMREEKRKQKKIYARNIAVYRTWKEVEEDIAYIEEYFNNLGHYTNRIADNLIIKTDKSKWYIDFSCIDEIKLWHGNHVAKHRTGHRNGFGDDYHLQFYVTNLRSIPSYIIGHDKGKYSEKDYSPNVLYEKKMKKLFDAI